jgi:hypothetical protein
MEFTVGELKEIIQDLDDDVKVVAISRNFEMKNSMVDAVPMVLICSTERRDFVDAFDGTPYSAKVYRPNLHNGEKTLFITG